MSDYWERGPNVEGRERGPVYRRTIEGIQFKIVPHWEIPTAGRYPAKSKVKDSHGARLVKHGYEIHGMPEVHHYQSGGLMLRLADTLSEAKEKCQRYAEGVADGSINSETGAFRRDR